MKISRLSLALLPLAFAPLGCAQPVGQVSDQGDYNSYYESTGNEETAADEKPNLETHEVHRESMDAQANDEEMTAKTEEAKAEETKAEEQTAAAEQPQTEEAAKEESAKTEQVSTEAEEVKPEEVANQQEGTFKDESAEQSAHVDPPQSQLEVSLAEVEQELMKAKETLAKYSTQQEKKDFRNGAQKMLDETIDANNKPLKEEIATLKRELDDKQQRLDAITMLTDQVQEQIDQLDPTSAEPDEALREKIRKSLARLRQLKAESNGRSLASQN